jgi:hypothetical protein
VSVTTAEFLNITVVDAKAEVKVVKAPADPNQMTGGMMMIRRRMIIIIMITTLMR